MNNQETQNLISKEEQLAKYEGDDRIVSSLEMKEEIAKQKDVFRFNAPFPTLEKLINGFEAGELILLSGATKHGKTSLGLTFTYHFEKEGVKCLWFSFEMPPRQLLAKFPEGKLPLFYLPHQLTDRNLNWIEQRILEAKLKFDCRIIFIDHLHFLLDMAQLSNASIQIGSIMGALKSIALKHNLVIFIVAHIRKFDATPKKQLPSYEDVRDSNLSSAYSDKVLMINRVRNKETKEFEDDAILSIELDRREGVMRKKIKLKFDGNLFYEPDQTETTQ